MVSIWNVFDKFYDSVIEENNHLGKEMSLGRAFYTWKFGSRNKDHSRADHTHFQFLNIVLDSYIGRAFFTWIRRSGYANPSRADLTRFQFLEVVLVPPRDSYIGVLSDLTKKEDTLKSLYGKNNLTAQSLSLAEELMQQILEAYENSLLPEVHKLFTTTAQEENLTCFPPGALKNIFLEIMDREEYGGGSKNYYDMVRYAILLEDLSFIRTNLVDIPSSFTEYQGVKVLFKEFETIAFEILSLIYSSLFDEKLATSMFDARRYAMLENISLFTEKYFSMVSGFDVRKEITRLIERNDGKEKSLARAYCTALRLNTSDPTREDHICRCILEYALESHDMSEKVRNLIPMWCRGEINKYEKSLLEEVSQEILSMCTMVHQSFTIPNMQLYQSTQDGLSPTEPTYEYMPCFIDFLLGILSCAEHEHIKESCGVDEIPPIIRYVVLLRQELTLLFTILGDIPFQFTNHDIFLPQFETISIEIGSLIYDCLFEKLTSTMFDERRDAMLKNFSLLKSFIEKHCHEFSYLSSTYVAPQSTVPIDSLFIVYSLIQDLENFNNSHFGCTVNDVVKQVNFLRHEMNLSMSLLEEIYKQPQHINKDERLTESLIKIRDVVYEAEYLIKSHVGGQSHAWYLNLRLPSVICKIKTTNTALQDIGGRDDLNNFNKEALSQPLLDPAEMVDNLVVGFKENTTRILDDLIRGPVKLNTICIFGMPGVGKTTTTRKLYEVVYKHFDRCAWCVVSQEYDEKRVLVQILMSLEPHLSVNNLQTLNNADIGLKIHQNLFKRRYLIVIDDVWQSSVLDELRRYFPDNANESRILLTTRNHNVAPTGCILRPLFILSEVQSWELLRNKVFMNEPCPPELLEHGKEIAANCRGLPLALVTTAGILRNVEKEEISWEKVLKQLNTHLLEDADTNYRKILELSFEHLPNHLKLCFLYLGVFREDTEIQTGSLIRLWIAERFIPRSDEKEPEDVEKEYLDDLISRSLLIIARRGSDGEIKTCRMHDLLRDMCIRRAHEENFITHIKGDEVPITGKHKCLISDSESPKWRYLPQYCRTYIGKLSTRSHTSISRMPLIRVLYAEPNRWYDTAPDYFVIPDQLRFLFIDRIPIYEEGYFSKLEFLHVQTDEEVTIPSIILKTAKLRYLRVKRMGQFEMGGYPTNSLRYFSQIKIGDKWDMTILTCCPLLRRLKCSSYNLPMDDLDFSFYTKLESLTVRGSSRFSKLLKENFPPTIKKLNLEEANIPWNMISVIGTLPNLHVLKLGENSFVGKEWNTIEGEFLELRFLKLQDLDLESWNTDDSTHFPKLQHLVLSFCHYLQDIPSDFGCHPTLQKTEVLLCNEELGKSAVSIEEEQHENGNEAFQVFQEW